MKKVRIGLLLMFLVLTGAWLSASESLVSENEQQVPTPKTAQVDTVQMTWQVGSTSPMTFSFNGEEGATYKVEWGDGKTETVIGKGAGTAVICSHQYYSGVSRTYTVLLYGVSK